MFRCPEAVINNDSVDVIIPDGQSDIPGDLNCSGSVGVQDLLILINQWGACDDCADCPADLNGSCSVGVQDLLILINNWG